jgi:hypothetical protein
MTRMKIQIRKGWVDIRMLRKRRKRRKKRMRRK